MSIELAKLNYKRQLILRDSARADRFNEVKWERSAVGTIITKMDPGWYPNFGQLAQQQQIIPIRRSRQPWSGEASRKVYLGRIKRNRQMRRLLMHGLIVGLALLVVALVIYGNLIAGELR